jgi:hypothetical protein
MSADEKHISFLNRIVMYKKVRHVENPTIPQDDDNERDYEIMEELNNNVDNNGVVDNTPTSSIVDNTISSGQIYETLSSKFVGVTVVLKEDTKFVARQNAKRNKK